MTLSPSGARAPLSAQSYLRLAFGFQLPDQAS
jgi:hypothetical protein